MGGSDDYKKLLWTEGNIKAVQTRKWNEKTKN